MDACLLASSKLLISYSNLKLCRRRRETFFFHKKFFNLVAWLNDCCLQEENFF